MDSPCLLMYRIVFIQEKDSLLLFTYTENISVVNTSWYNCASHVQYGLWVQRLCLSTSSLPQMNLPARFLLFFSLTGGKPSAVEGTFASVKANETVGEEEGRTKSALLKILAKYRY